MSPRQRWLFSQYLWHHAQAEHYREQMDQERRASRISAPLFAAKEKSHEQRCVSQRSDAAGVVGFE